MNERDIAFSVAAGRVAIGAGLLAAPGLAASGWVGRAAGAPATQLFARATGARDLGIGLGVIAALRGKRDLRQWLVASLIADAADAVATLLVRDELPPVAAVNAVAVAGGSAVIDAVLLARLD